MLKFGLGVTGLLFVSAALTLPAIAKPPTSHRNLITSKSEVGSRMLKLTAYQITYFHGHGQFGQTFQEVANQKALNHRPKPQSETTTYSYQILPHPQSGNMTMIAAVPKQSSRPTIIGFISGTQKSNRSDGKGGKETLTIGILCQSKAPGAAVPAWSSIGKPDATLGFNCPTGF
jgi:Type IV pilin-like G and H, putative